MDKIKDSPPPLKRKLFLTVLVGLLCLLIGAAMCIFAKDRIMLFLSGAVCIFSLIKAFTLYRVLSEKKYEVIEGTCVGVVLKPLRKFRKIRIMDDEGNESSLLLSKQSKVKIGDRYRFYFKQTQRITFGSEYFEAAMSSDCFLGYEAIGEPGADSPKEKPQSENEI